jgi:creatinine amidohydrolase
MAKVELEKMSWTEVRDLDREKTVMLIPIGTVEQHGPAGILGSDYVVAYRFSAQVAEASRDLAVTPPVCYGLSHSFKHFPGTLSIRPSTLEALLRDVCEALISHGFKKLIFVNSHAGNEPSCENVAREILDTHGITMGLVFPWRLSMHLGRDLYENPAKSFGHGAEPTISVMMHLFPGQVDESRLAAGTTKPTGSLKTLSASKVEYKGYPLGLYRYTEAVNELGASADPEGASAEKGKIIFERMVEYGVGAIDELRKFIGPGISR